MSPKPILLGYQTIRLDTGPEHLRAGRTLITDFAAAEGYALGELFIEWDMNSPCSALVAMISAVPVTDAKAIAVPYLSDLGRLTRVQDLTRARIERETGIPIIVITTR